jgi:methylated-DNA-[protein]-cysteine S-methyltransferase
MTPVTTTIASPIGPLTLTAVGSAITGLHMHRQRHAPPVDPGCVRDDSAFGDVAEQLAAYFSGDLREFDVELSFAGTAFQQRVWGALRDIPYGETTSYGEVARRVGNPKASRAVGLATGRNPVAVIVPCHRVVGADGGLTGFGGGLERKVWLLEHEGVVVGGESSGRSGGDDHHREMGVLN